MHFIAKLFLSLSMMAAAGCANLQPAQAPDVTYRGAHAFGVTAFAYSPDGANLASGGYKGDIRLWTAPSLEPKGRLGGHSDKVRGLGFVTEDRLVSTGQDGQIMVWDLRARTALFTRSSTPATALSAGPERVVTGHQDGHVRTWRFPSLDPISDIRLDAPVVSLTRHGDLIAVATGSGKVSLYSSKLIHQRDLQEKGPVAHDLRFSPDGALLASGAWFTLMLWDVAAGTRTLVPAEHTGLVVSVDFSTDGKQIASIGRHTDAAIRLWDREHLVPARRYLAHELCGAMIRFSPDGRFMASVSDDESIRIYDLTRPYLPQWDLGARGGS